MSWLLFIVLAAVTKKGTTGSMLLFSDRPINFAAVAADFAENSTVAGYFLCFWHCKGRGIECWLCCLFFLKLAGHPQKYLNTVVAVASAGAIGVPSLAMVAYPLMAACRA